jgi:hypothetical protein
MLFRVAFATAVAAAALVIAPGATAAVDPLEYESAVTAMHAVDRSIPAPANASDRDFVVGASRNEDATLALAAQSGPNGEDPRGQGVAIAPSTRTQFEVTCLDVLGPLAAVGVIVTRSTFLPEGFELVIFVRDTMAPGGMGDGHNVIALPAESCEGAAPLAATVPPHEHGNWVVGDAIALP